MNKTLFLLLAVTLLFGTFGMTFLGGSSAGIFLIIVPALFIWIFAWVLPTVLKRVDTKVWIVTGLIILLGLIFPTSSLMSSSYQFGPFSTGTSAIIFLLPSIALVNAAFLLYAGFKRISSGMANDKTAVFSFALGTLLIIKVLHNIYDLTLWDNTYDPLDYLWLIVPIFIVVLSGLTLSVALSGRMKSMGLLFSVIVTAMLIAASAFAQNVDFRQETAKRAERTVSTIESYYAREGGYPESLSQLSPRYILSIPKPMIIYGQDWCYEGGDDYYRLGYIDRKHWSDPNLIARVYKSVGESADTQSLCMEEFNSIRKQIPDFPYTYGAAGN